MFSATKTDQKWIFWVIIISCASEVIGTKETVVRFTEYQRRSVAKERQIANMWKMSWDIELLNELERHPRECDDLLPGKNYRVFLVPANEFTLAYENFLYNEYIKDPAGTLSYNNNSYLGFFELFLPGQTRVACVFQKCVFGRVRRSAPEQHEKLDRQNKGSAHRERFAFGSRNVPRSQSDEKLTYSEMCFVGPHSTFSPSDIVNGTPGTICGPYFNDDGLCSFDSGLPINRLPSDGQKKDKRHFRTDERAPSPLPPERFKVKEKKEEEEQENNSTRQGILLISIAHSVFFKFLVFYVKS